MIGHLKTYLLLQLQKLQAVASRKNRTIGVSLLRVALGTIILAVYVHHIALRGFLWGDQGVISYPDFVQLMHMRRSFSLFLFSSNPMFGTLVFYAGMLVSLAFTLGFMTRITSVFFYIFTWSLYTRNPFCLDGGDNLLYLLAFYLMFTDCGAHFSIDRALKKERPRRDNPFVAVIHNFGVMALVAQMCLLYFTSAFFKMQGHMWQDGTAIYYILRAAEFNLSPMAKIFWANDTVVTLLTWSTMVFQMSWPFLIFQRKARPVLALGALCLHSMIGYFMGLFWFSAVMISGELIIFDDKDYNAMGSLLSKLWNALMARFSLLRQIPEKKQRAASSAV